jgi:3'(2'), 5'-bisphosphate nucleotidase
MEVYGTTDFGTELKADESPVTAADRRAHEVIAEHLSATGLPVLSEEGTLLPYEQRVAWAYYWLVDPLDGTKEFISRNGEFTVNIALMHRGTPVAGVIYIPCTDTLYVGDADNGVFKNGKQLPRLSQRVGLDELLKRDEVVVVASRSHLSPETADFIRQFSHVQLTTMGSSLKFMLLAEGKADIYPRMAPTMEWDTAAAHAILNAANRGVYQVDLDSELVYNKSSLKNPSFIAF